MTAGEAISVAVGAIAATAAVRAMPAAARSHRASRRRRPTPPPPAPSDLRTFERMLRLATASAGETHHRLVPALREIAARRLASGSRIDLYADPPAARAVVSPATWDLIRPDRSPPANRHARGPGMPALEAAIAELEGMGDG